MTTYRSSSLSAKMVIQTGCDGRQKDNRKRQKSERNDRYKGNNANHYSKPPPKTDHNHKLTCIPSTLHLIWYHVQDHHFGPCRWQKRHTTSRTPRPPALVYAGRRLAASTGPLVSIGVRLLTRPFACATLRDCVSFSPVLILAGSDCTVIGVLFLLL
jgi:hypothetical protein